MKLFSSAMNIILNNKILIDGTESIIRIIWVLDIGLNDKVESK